MNKTPKDMELRVAALLHDFGKPDKETMDEEGWNHYYEHEPRSADLVLEFMETFKIDNNTRDNVYKIVRHHNRDLNTGMGAFKRLVRDVGIELFPKFLKLREADALSHNLFGELPDAIKNLSLAKERYIKILEDKDAMSLKDLAIDGCDLIEMGLEGKEIGDALNMAFEYVTEHPEFNNKDKLLKLIKDK
jgi:tRNA nucleotidyltransferase (CCA-adding enzyme)